MTADEALEWRIEDPHLLLRHRAVHRLGDDSCPHDHSTSAIEMREHLARHCRHQLAAVIAVDQPHECGNRLRSVQRERVDGLDFAARAGCAMYSAILACASPTDRTVTAA